MKAVVRTEYGPPDVLKLKEIERPTPKENQVLVEVHAASVNALDWRFLRGKPALVRVISQSGVRKPKTQILGVDVAGRVVAVGSAVKKLKLGDEVFGGASGSFAEYACAREDRLALKPSNLTFEESAAVPVAAVTALQGLRDMGQVQPGQKVLIYGASGGVGTFAVQIAKYYGADVTAVCSTKNLDGARSLGADQVIDYTKEDFRKNGQIYDVVGAVNGHLPLLDYRRAVRRGGTCVMIGGTLGQFFSAAIFGRLAFSRSGGKKIRIFIAKIKVPDLLFLKELLEAGKLRPAIDRRYVLSETSEAFRYIEDEHPKGKVVITLDRESSV